MVAEITSLEIKTKLKEVFGFDSFRGRQEDIVDNILAGRNTFVIMPTGAGKSLCYQLPAIILPGTAVVISPLIALMKNQVDQMNAVGVNAQFMNSTLSKAEITRVKGDVLSGKTKLLYVAPESLTKEENILFLKKVNLSFVAIDEAHCISEWGHDFRPEYRRIRNIVDMIGNLPVMALTATATPKVQQDIQKNLNMEDACVYKTSFNRPNLYYEVLNKMDAKKNLIRFIKNQTGESGIIYCLSRKRVEELAEYLTVNDIKAVPYHAGLEPAVRIRNQDAFLNQTVDVVVATIAFGMGIDKPDVRFVIHYDAPKSLEGYYQETGRAGRDGMEGHCLMFYSYQDIQKLEKFNKNKNVTERDNARYLLDQMADYAEAGLCRRRQLLNYFGEGLDRDCGFCDNCQKPTPRVRVEAEVSLAIQGVILTEGRFGPRHVAEVITGSNNDYIESYGHNKLGIYGKGKNQEISFWISLLRQLNVIGLLEKDIDNLGVLKVSESGHDYLLSPFPVSFSKDHTYTTEAADDEDALEGAKVRAYDEKLFNQLKGLVKKVAKDKNLPPYVIFQDPSLAEMATTYPTTESDLSQIVGVGIGKVKKFGAPFLVLINKYVEENEIETESDIVIKTQVSKSMHKVEIIRQIDRKVDLEEIVGNKAMPMVTLLTEIENICFSGTKLNLDYYIDKILDDNKQEEIFDYFMGADTDGIAPALLELGDEYSEDEIRLMRIKFFSEHAN